MSAVDLNQLKQRGLVPHDSQIISEHNNTIIESASERLIGRVATVDSIDARDTPGDLRYAHTIAWEMRSTAAVVSPVAELPIVDDGVVVSFYPKLDQVAWTGSDARSIHQKLSVFNNSMDVLSKNTARMLYTLDIAEYANRRINYVASDGRQRDERLIDFMRVGLNYYIQHYPFSELTADDEALVHGDLHANNLVATSTGQPRIIDLDSTSLGPRLYDLASWCVRFMRGDPAPVVKMIELERCSSRWEEETFRVLMGWKIISSLTHELRYQQGPVLHANIAQLACVAVRLNIPGKWSL